MYAVYVFDVRVCGVCVSVCIDSCCTARSRWFRWKKDSLTKITSGHCTMCGRRRRLDDYNGTSEHELA